MNQKCKLVGYDEDDLLLTVAVGDLVNELFVSFDDPVFKNTVTDDQIRLLQ